MFWSLFCQNFLSDATWLVSVGKHVPASSVLDETWDETVLTSFFLSVELVFRVLLARYLTQITSWRVLKTGSYPLICITKVFYNNYYYYHCATQRLSYISVYSSSFVSVLVLFNISTCNKNIRGALKASANAQGQRQIVQVWGKTICIL